MATIAVMTIVLLGNFAQAVHAASDPCIEQSTSMTDACAQITASKDKKKNDAAVPNWDVACHACGHLTGSSVDKLSWSHDINSIKIERAFTGLVIEDLYPQGLFRPPRSA